VCIENLLSFSGLQYFLVLFLLPFFVDIIFKNKTQKKEISFKIRMKEKRKTILKNPKKSVCVTFYQLEENLSPGKDSTL
jgi:hypothetical protein